jgi:hypothetical protein
MALWAKLQPFFDQFETKVLQLSPYLVFHILRSVYSSLCSRDLDLISRKLLPSGPQRLQFCFSLLSQV